MNYTVQLISILKAAGWSQEKLARELGVSFPTLNAWVNERSKPRKSAISRIEALYLNIVGQEAINDVDLVAVKGQAVKLTIDPKKLIENKTTLNKLTLYLTYHTNTIEGSTMTLSDVEEVLFEHKVLSNRTAVEQAEARNHQAALNWLLEQLSNNSTNFVINERLILGLHLRLMNGIISDAGQYRTHSVRILGAHVALANWQKIPRLISGLSTYLAMPSVDIIGKLAKTHADFEKIHPFSDGNGRTGRLILLAQSLRAGLVPPLVAKERKNAYYKYLEIAQTKDDYKPLELFIAQSIQFCDDVLKAK